MNTGMQKASIYVVCRYAIISDDLQYGDTGYGVSIRKIFCLKINKPKGNY